MTSPIEQASAALLDARRSGRTVAALPIADEAAAYAVQGRVLQGLGQGPATHWKSGGRTLAEQTHAPLPPAGIHASPADLRDWPFLSFRGVEAEIALRLSRAVSAEEAATLDVDGARALVDAMTVTLELCDARWTEGREASALAKLADFQSHGMLIVGTWLPYTPQADWASQRCTVHIGDDAARLYTGTHTLGDPAAVLPLWLRHATQDGPLPAGTVVTTGSWCGMVVAPAGAAVRVVFDGIGEVSVQL